MRVSIECTKTSSRSTRLINRSSVCASDVSNSPTFASRNAAPRTSLRLITPRPVNNHSAFTSSFVHTAARNSTLGGAPVMYRRAVSAFVDVKSPTCR